MKTRILAAVLIGTLFCSSVPLAMALSQREPDQTVQRTSAAEHDHSCCPGIHLGLPPRLFLKPLEPTIPCGEQHPCCARQGQENPASLPATARSALSFLEISAAVLDSTLKAAPVAALRIGASPSPSYSERSTVLRI